MSLTRTIECAMLNSLSRALLEEVQFDTARVTSVDWISHPTLTHSDTPERIDVVLVNGDPNPNRPDLAPCGGGETACKPMLAAVGNASTTPPVSVCVAYLSARRVYSRHSGVRAFDSGFQPGSLSGRDIGAWVTAHPSWAKSRPIRKYGKSA